jgi:CobQ-like glutamine amidotransferase family enzyme
MDRHGQQEMGNPARPLRLVWVYPDLLSTYGDRGNVLVLERRARLRGLPVEIVEVNSDQPVPRDGGIYLMGGGEDLPQTLAARRLLADGGLHAAADNGAVVFAVCAGYQMLGTEFGGADGAPVRGLGLLDMRSGRGERRSVGEIVADVDPGLNVGKLTGFENHQGVTRLGPNARPLARTTLGTGNGDGTEGAYAGRILGTYARSASPPSRARTDPPHRQTNDAAYFGPLGGSAVNLAAAAIPNRLACPVSGALRCRRRPERGNFASRGNFARISRVLFPADEKFPR